MMLKTEIKNILKRTPSNIPDTQMKVGNCI